LTHCNAIPPLEIRTARRSTSGAQNSFYDLAQDWMRRKVAHCSSLLYFS